MHVGDASQPLPGGDEGGASNATLMTTRDRTGETPAIVSPTVSVADGKLTVKVHRYGWADLTPNDNNNNPTYQGLTDADGENALATAEFDLEALAANGAGAKTIVNGPKWADSVMETVQAQRDQIATLQSLGTRTTSTRAAEATAWQTAVNAVQYQLFGGNLRNKLTGDYGTDTDLQEDALGLLDRVLDALSNANNLFAATDPGGTGVFDNYPVDLNNDGTIGTDVDGLSEATLGIDINRDGDMDDTLDNVNEQEWGHFIVYDATADRRWEAAGNNRALAAFLGEREHKVVASLGTTNYTRFGVWYRVGTASAVRVPTPNVRKNEGGPGSFAYSPLDPTMAGNATNPTSVAGSMSITLGDLVDSTGDPLAYTAAIDGNTPAAGHEIAEIVFSGMAIEVGLPGGNSGNLIVGAETQGTGTDAGTWTYAEIGLTAASDVRYRLSAIGMEDQAGSGDASAAALFVGQGVDGPLGVIGTFTLSDQNVARVNAAGTGTEEPTNDNPIYGGFGADIP